MGTNIQRSHVDAPHSASDTPPHRISMLNLNGTRFPARDAEALPALTVTAEASSSTARHRYSSSLGSLGVLGSLWSINSIPSRPGSASGQPATHHDSATLLKPSGRKHQRTKSAGSITTVSSQPVLVRTYTSSRTSSRNGSPHPTTIPRNMSRRSRLPPAQDFSFDAVLRAVEPEIQSAIDAIAEICARSRMSLADEHAAHIPPQGEIREDEPGWRGRQQGGRQGWRVMGRTLTAVPEASSSSERLAGGSKASSDSGRGKNSAYGSLKEIITGRKNSQGSKDGGDTSFNASESTFVGEASSLKKDRELADHASPESQTSPSAALISSPTASKQLSLVISTPQVATQSNVPPTQPLVATEVPGPPMISASTSRTSWLSWPRLSTMAAVTSSNTGAPRAETRLKSLLRNTNALGT